MAQIDKMEAEVEVECCGEKLFEILTGKRTELPKLCSHRVASTDAHPDDWKCAQASVRRWDLVIDGKPQYMREKMSVDEEKREVRYSILDGDVMKNHCKKLDIKLKTVEVGEGRCCAKWSFEYEKVHEDAPPPHKEMEYMLNLTKDLAARLANA